MQAPEKAPGHDPYVALRNPDYRLYASGSFLANLGGQMQTVAIGWEIFERTSSEFMLGLVGLVQIVPVLLLTLPSGHIADQFNRRRVMMASLCVTVLCSLGLALLSARQGSIAWMYSLLMLTGAARALLSPARASLLPQILPGAVFSNGVTWNSSFGQIASMSGPALGGIVIARTHGASAAYLLAAVGAALFVLFLSRLRTQHAPRPVEKPTFESLVAGFRFVRRTQVILGSITLDMVAVLLGGATTLLPVYAKEILQVGPEGYGWLRACPSIGAFVMAITLAHRRPMQRAGRTLLLAVAAFGLATIVFGLSRSYLLSMLALVALGAADNISVVIRHSLVQTRTPDELRGRVSAVNSLFIGSSNELGGFESGTVAHFFGPTVSVVSGGIGTILVVIVAALRWPKLRNLKSLAGPD